MGKGKGGKAKGDDEKKRRREKEEEWRNTRGDAPGQRGNYENLVMENPRFEAFYKAQGFIADDEWDQFMTCVKSSLPACFRINEDYAFADTLKEQMLSFVGQKITVGGVEMNAAEQMPWYPCAYKLGMDRKAIRKQPEMSVFHQWMMQHTDCGNITRQEAGEGPSPASIKLITPDLRLNLALT